MVLLNKIKYWIDSSEERSKTAYLNIAGSFANKVLAIFINLILVSVTINYLDSYQYGVWLTLSSIVAWMSYFDLGLGHGFKNKLAEAIANNDIVLAKQYISTTYVVLALIFSIVILVVSIVNKFIDWSSLLNVPDELNALLRTTMSIIIITTGISLVVNLIGGILMAFQQSAKSAFITTLGQGLALLFIYILTFFKAKSIIYISIVLTCAPIIVSVIATIWLFNSKFKQISPSISAVKFSLTNKILGLGGKFFIIQLSMLVIFQMVNIILSRILGPDAVTQYNVAYKYFSILQMVFLIILSPYWVAYTDAFTKRDFLWIKKTNRQLSKIFFIIVGIELLLLFLSPIAFKLWLGDEVHVDWALSIAMSIYIIAMSYSNMYMIFLNGIGKVYIQALVYVLFAIISIPLSVLGCRHFGIIGILIVLTIVYLTQAVIAKIQISKILNQKAYGIWNR